MIEYGNKQYHSSYIILISIINHYCFLIIVLTLLRLLQTIEADTDVQCTRSRMSSRNSTSVNSSMQNQIPNTRHNDRNRRSRRTGAAAVIQDHAASTISQYAILLLDEGRWLMIKEGLSEDKVRMNLSLIVDERCRRRSTTMLQLQQEVGGDSRGQGAVLYLIPNQYWVLEIFYFFLLHNFLYYINHNHHM